MLKHACTLQTHQDIWISVIYLNSSPIHLRSILLVLSPVPPNQQKVNSVAEGFDACQNHSCNGIKDRPILQSGATVYVVFGIKGVDRSEMQAGHVLTQFRVSILRLVDSLSKD